MHKKVETTEEFVRPLGEGWRKIIVIFMALLATVMVAAAGGIDDKFVDIVTKLVAFYIAGNVGEHAATKFRRHK